VLLGVAFCWDWLGLWLWLGFAGLLVGGWGLGLCCAAVAALLLGWVPGRAGAVWLGWQGGSACASQLNRVTPPRMRAD